MVHVFNKSGDNFLVDFSLFFHRFFKENVRKLINGHMLRVN